MANTSAPPRDDFCELEDGLLQIIDLGRREEQSRAYGRALERLLVEKGLISEEDLQAVAAEAHTIAALETAFNPKFEKVRHEAKKSIEDLRAEERL